MPQRVSHVWTAIRSMFGLAVGIWKGFLVSFLFSPHPSFRKAWCLDWPHQIARHLDCSQSPTVFFRKIVEIEHFVLRAAIFRQPPPPPPHRNKTRSVHKKTWRPLVSVRARSWRSYDTIRDRKQSSWQFTRQHFDESVLVGLKPQKMQF